MDEPTLVSSCGALSSTEIQSESYKQAPSSNICIPNNDSLNISTIGDSDLPLVIAIVGCTGVGKTKLSLALSKLLPHAELVNMDSMQVYSRACITSAKPSLSEQSQAIHHLFSCHPCFSPFTVQRFIRRAFVIIEDIISRGGLPIIVGGSFHYTEQLLIQNFCSNTALAISDQDVPLHPEMISVVQLNPQAHTTLYSYRAWARHLSATQLYDMLFTYDPAAATRFARQSARLLRCLEIAMEYGETPTSIYQTPMGTAQSPASTASNATTVNANITPSSSLRYRVCMIAISASTPVLASRAVSRVCDMLQLQHSVPFRLHTAAVSTPSLLTTIPTHTASSVHPYHVSLPSPAFISQIPYVTNLIGEVFSLFMDTIYLQWMLWTFSEQGAVPSDPFSLTISFPEHQVTIPAPCIEPAPVAAKSIDRADTCTRAIWSQINSKDGLWQGIGTKDLLPWLFYLVDCGVIDISCDCHLTHSDFATNPAMSPFQELFPITPAKLAHLYDIYGFASPCAVRHQAYLAGKTSVPCIRYLKHLRFLSIFASANHLFLFHTLQLDQPQQLSQPVVTAAPQVQVPDVSLSTAPFFHFCSSNQLLPCSLRSLDQSDIECTSPLVHTELGHSFPSAAPIPASGSRITCNLKMNAPFWFYTHGKLPCIESQLLFPTQQNYDYIHQIKTFDSLDAIHWVRFSSSTCCFCLECRFVQSLHELFSKHVNEKQSSSSSSSSSLSSALASFLLTLQQHHLLPQCSSVTSESIQSDTPLFNICLLSHCLEKLSSNTLRLAQQQTKWIDQRLSLILQNNISIPASLCSTVSSTNNNIVSSHIEPASDEIPPQNFHSSSCGDLSNDNLSRVQHALYQQPIEVFCFDTSGIFTNHFHDDKKTPLPITLPSLIVNSIRNRTIAQAKGTLKNQPHDASREMTIKVDDTGAVPATTSTCPVCSFTSTASAVTSSPSVSPPTNVATSLLPLVPGFATTIDFNSTPLSTSWENYIVTPVLACIVTYFYLQRYFQTESKRSNTVTKQLDELESLHPHQPPVKMFKSNISSNHTCVDSQRHVCLSSCSIDVLGATSPAQHPLVPPLTSNCSIIDQISKTRWSLLSNHLSDRLQSSPLGFCPCIYQHPYLFQKAREFLSPTDDNALPNKELSADELQASNSSPRASSNPLYARSKPIICELCDITILGDDQWKSHVKGKRHKSKARAASNQATKLDVPN